MSKEKRLNIAQVLQVLQEVKGKQVDAAKKLQTSTATISRCLKDHGYVPVITYVSQTEREAVDEALREEQRKRGLR